MAHPKPIWRAWWCLLQKPRQPQVQVRRCHPGALQGCGHKSKCICNIHQYPIGSMYAIYGNIYHQYTPNVSIYSMHGSYGYTICLSILVLVYFLVWMIRMIKARFHLQACKGPEVGWNHLWTETLDPSAAAHSSGLYLSFREKEHVKISQNEFWCLTALLIPGATLLRGFNCAENDRASTAQVRFFFKRLWLNISRLSFNWITGLLPEASLNPNEGLGTCVSSPYQRSCLYTIVIVSDCLLSSSCAFPSPNDVMMSCCPTPEVQGQSRLCIAKWIDQTWIPALCCCLCIVYVVCQHGYVEQSVRQARSTVCIFIRPFTRFVSGSIWIGGPIWVVRPSHCWNNFAGWTEIQWNWLTADWNLLSTVDQEFVTHRVSM